MKVVSSLHIYPIKSCRGIAVDAFRLDDRGPENDRRWMLVDAERQFMTQREHPRMALIDVAVENGEVIVSAPGMSVHAFGSSESQSAVTCVIWKDTVELQHVAPKTSRWFSDFLGVDCKLMRMPQTTARVVNPTYSPDLRLVTLADGYPMMLMSTASVELLNQKLKERGEAPVPMERFRPNIVVSHTGPHEEDEWTTVTIGEVACNIVKPCERCAITTVDVQSGVAGKEPLRTLSEYRKVGSKVWFGQNVIHASAGTIRVGDAVV